MALYRSVFRPSVTTNAVSNNDATPVYWPGEVFVEDETGNKYVYTKYNSGTASVTCENGLVVYINSEETTGLQEVNPDESDSDVNHVAGVMLAEVSDGYYGFMQVWGYHSAVKTNGDDDIVAYVTLIAAGDGTCDSMGADTAATNKILGYAVAADDDDNDTVAAHITVGCQV